MGITFFNCNIHKSSYTCIGSGKINFAFLAAGMAKKDHKSKIDLYVISQVTKMRILKGYTQEDVAIHLDVSTCYIGHIESPNFRAKYNTAHINELAKFFRCSPKDFFPEKPL